MLLKNRNFLILMIGVAISGTGMWVGIIGNLEFLQQNIESSFIQALIILAGFIVGVFLAPLAGQIIDNNYKKKVLIYSWGVRVSAVVFMFLAIHFNSVAWMVVYTFLMGISGAFLNPTIQTILPMIVKKENLITANGVNVNIFTAARIVGTALGGVLLISLSLFSLYFTVMVAFALTLIGTLFLKVEEELVPSDEKKKNGNVFSAFKQLAPIVKGKPKVISAMLLVIPAFLFISGFNLMVIEISELQADAAIKGILYTTEGICVFIGTFIAKKLFNSSGSIKPLILITFVISFAQMSLYFADIKWASIAAFGLFGMAAGALFPVVTTIFQTEVEQEYHGRFFSMKGMLENILFQVLMLLTGLFLDTIGFKTMVLVFGIFSLMFVIFILFTRGNDIKANINEDVELSK